MVYIIRLFYAWLLPPGLFLIIFLLMYYLFAKTKKKHWLVLIFTLIYLLSIRIVKDTLIKPLENYYNQPIINELQEAQAIIILGGGCCNGVTDFDGEGQIAESAANRFLMGLRLHNVLHLPIIISGGQGFSRTVTEAEIGARTLKACGVQDKYLLKEEKSRNTLENARFTKQLCQKNNFQKVILVTSAFHLPRSTMLFQREGVDVIPYPSDYRTHKETVIDAFAFTPTYIYLSNSAAALKEYLGILAIMIGVQ